MIALGRVVMKLYLKGNTLGFICLCAIVWSKKIMKDFLPWLGKQWDRMYRMLDFLPWLSEQMDRMIRKNQKIFDCLLFFLLICGGITIFIMPIYAVVFDGHDRSILWLCIPGCGLTWVAAVIFIIALKDMIGSKQEKIFTDAVGDSKAVFNKAESEARAIYDKAVAEAKAVFEKAESEDDSKAVYEKAESEARVIYDKAIAEAELRAKAVFDKAESEDEKDKGK